MRMRVEVLLLVFRTTIYNMDVVAVCSDSEYESEVIRPTSAVVFTPTWTLW